MNDNVLDIHRRALSDYRIALGLELRSRRTTMEYSFEKPASLSHIPAEHYVPTREAHLFLNSLE